MPIYPTHIILIGGSSGSLPIIKKLINNIPPHSAIPVIIIVHRLKNVQSELSSIFANNTGKKTIKEPEDKEIITPNNIYLAPQNYHLLFEADGSFSLDYSELVHYSRPSIDVSFQSAAAIYKTNVLSILLTGANADGAMGSDAIVNNGGTALVQDPKESPFSAMPLSAIEKNKKCIVLTEKEIGIYLHSYIQKHNK